MPNTITQPAATEPSPQAEATRSPDRPGGLNPGILNVVIDERTKFGSSMDLSAFALDKRTGGPQRQRIFKDYLLSVDPYTVK